VGTNFGSESVFLKSALSKGRKTSGGAKIAKTVAYQYTKGKAYGRGEQIDVSGEQNTTMAKWTYRYYDWPITITRQDQLEVNGEAMVHDLMKTKMMVARRGAEEMLSTHLFTGTGNDTTKEISCLDHALDNTGNTLATSATYGEISKTTDTWWGGNVLTLGGNTHGPVYSNLQKVWRLAHDGTIQPTLVLVATGAFDTYMSTQQPQQQFLNDDSLTSGFRRTMFNGRPMVADGHMVDSATETANRVYMLNMDYFDLITHEDENFTFEDWAKPIDQNMLVAHLRWAGNVVTSDPSRHAVGYNFDWDATAA
jgi:hypothetical protein